MKFKRYQTWSAIAFFLAGIFLVLSLYTLSRIRGGELLYVATRKIGGKVVEIYRIKGFEDMVVSIERKNPSGEILISNSEDTAPFVTVSVADRRVREVVVVNSKTDYLTVKTKMDEAQFSRLDRVTAGSETTLRAQVDNDLDGVMDEELEIPR